MDFTPSVEEMEAGVTVFLTQVGRTAYRVVPVRNKIADHADSKNHHIDLGVVLLSTANGTLALHFRWRAVSQITTPDPIVIPVPANWTGKPLLMEIKAINSTHYSFSSGPADAMSMMLTVGYGAGSLVSFGFTGTLVGVYATSNGGNITEDAYFSKWRYQGQGQFLN